jgi:hypothetical protein
MFAARSGGPVTDPQAARAFLLGEIEALAPFDYLAASPGGRPLNLVEVTRREDRGLEVRVPGRPALLPELSAEVQRALGKRGFESEAPEDPTKPWVRAVPDEAAAVDLAQAVLTEVFGEKPDFDLDLAHGSHEAEHRARQKLAAMRARLEEIVAGVAGHRVEQDADGDYLLPIRDVHVVVAPRVPPGGPVVVRIFAITNVGVTVTPELGLFLARLNFGLMFGRFALDAEHRSIWFDETLLGESFTDDELRFTIEMVATTADQWDDRLKQMFGGVTHQELLKQQTPSSEPLTKPGQGGYL